MKTLLKLEYDDKDRLLKPIIALIHKTFDNSKKEIVIEKKGFIEVQRG